VKHENSVRIQQICITTVSLICLMLTGISSVQATGSVEAGKTKSITCAACHGQDGNSVNPEWPSIAGQHANYIVTALKTFKNGERNNLLMGGQAAALSEQDMEDLAAYYSVQKPVARTSDPALVAGGERLYRGGNSDRGVSACIACHGPKGAGNSAAGYPSLAGQHSTYTITQLLAYQKGERTTDRSQMMRDIAALMTDDEIASVASYIQGLR